MQLVLPFFCFGIALTIARDVPQNLAEFLEKVKAGGACENHFPGTFFDVEHGQKSFRYCKGDGFIYLKGPGDKLANMDVDCDGQRNSLCQVEDSDTQLQTSFRDTVRKYYGINDLDASIHNYVVFGNSNDHHTPGYTTFDPSDPSVGVEPLSLMAVVCDNHLFYGIWGDQNGDDGPPLVGEASISLARLCFGDSMTNDKGHDQADVLYITFTGQHAVPGANGANWKAKSSADFQNYKAFNDLGNSLVQQIQV